MRGGKGHFGEVEPIFPNFSLPRAFFFFFGSVKNCRNPETLLNPKPATVRKNLQRIMISLGLVDLKY